MTRYLLTALSLFAFACDAELNPGTGETDTDMTETGETAETGDSGDSGDTGSDAEVTSLSIDATSEEAWAYVDLSTGDVVTGSDAWQIAFRRATVAVNGGVSGDRGVTAQLVSGDLEAGLTIPSSGWLDDTVEGEGDDATEFFAFDGWYEYDMTNHTLSPAAGTWLVKDADGTVWGVQIGSYYDNAGTSAVFQLDTLLLQAGQ